MRVGLHLDSERHALLSAMLLRRELRTYAVDLDGNFCFNLWSRIPHKLDAVQAMWIDLYVKQATAQRDVCTHTHITTQNFLS